MKLCGVATCFAIFVAAGSAQANTLSSDACVSGVRDFSVTATSVVGCLQVGAGNINGNGDAFQTANPGWQLADKSDVQGNLHEGWLTVTGMGTTGGTFAIASSAYATYDRIAIGFKSGNGQADPDWAVFELADGTLGGNWSVSGNQAMSHANLYGFGTPSVTPVPEPEAFMMFAVGLAALATACRRKKV